jgi:ABC-type sugar transport system substrate-binding protein
MARRKKVNPVDGQRTSVADAAESAPTDSGIRRSEFLSRAGKVALGAGFLSAQGGLRAAVAAAAPVKTSTVARTASSKAKEIAFILNGVSPFYEQSFQMPLINYLKKDQKGWGQTFGNENASIPTGISLLDEYVAANDAVVFLGTGDDMSSWQSAVQKAVAAGTLFLNTSSQAVGGATQNVLFSHKDAGVGIGKAAAAWCKTNGVTAPVVGLLGNLSDAQGIKRTTWAWNTIKSRFPKATLAGSVQAIDTPTGASGSANLLSAHPTINVLICFNTPAGIGALTSAKLAGKTNRDTFYIGCTDVETQTLKLIEAQNSLLQSNWGTFFPASTVLMAKDAINKVHGKTIKPTRLLTGLAITTPKQAKSFNTVAYNPLDPKNAYVFTRYFKYLDTPVGTGQVPPGQ